jgi:hypothetical protein
MLFKRMDNETLRFVMARVPRIIRDVMLEVAGASDPKLPQAVFLAGGAIRAIIAGEKVNDYDLFVSSPSLARSVADRLITRIPGGARLTETANAITITAPGRTPIQCVTNWTYTDIIPLLNAFDFTIAQAAVGVHPPDGTWEGWHSESFYQDLAAKRLRYLSPERLEHPGGSLLRMRKFLRQGYSIQVESLAALLARLIKRGLFEGYTKVGGGYLLPNGPFDITNEKDIAHLLKALLVEIDPLIMIDGLEVVEDEHQERLTERPFDHAALTPNEN